MSAARTVTLAHKALRRGAARSAQGILGGRSVLQATSLSHTLSSAVRAPNAARELHSRCPFAAAAAAVKSAINPSAPTPAPRVFKNPYADHEPLTPEDIAVVKQTVPVLAEHGVTLTTMFYKKMFANHPQLKNVFNQAHQASGMQPKALASAVYAYAANIENLGALGPAVRLMSHKHASLSILPEQYPVVGSNLLATLDELLISAGFPRQTVDTIIAAWGKAYAQLANILIVEEEKLYQTAESVHGGWRGWRKFVVKSKIMESQGGADIASFELVPEDGGAIPSYLPGQFTTVRAEVPATPTEGTITQPRQYSLSKASDGHSFRITVKRENARPGETASPAGCVSTLLHSTLKEGSVVELAPPFGDFTLDLESKAPVVLMGAGVGITPLVPMAEAAKLAGRPVTFLYAVESSQHHPMRKWLQNHKSTSKDFISRVWYRSPASTDELGKDFDSTGTMDLSQVWANVSKDAEFYMCGPTGFMAAQMAALKARGVAESKLHAEAFGTGTVA